MEVGVEKKRESEVSEKGSKNDSERKKVGFLSAPRCLLLSVFFSSVAAV